MKTIETTIKAGSDKVLHLAIPVEEANREYRMVIVISPNTEAEPPSASDNRGWPPGFIENTYGSIDDETFIRHPQGEYEKRLEFE